MARVVGVTPSELTAAGREDAARVLEEMLRRERPAIAAVPDIPQDGSIHDLMTRILSDDLERFIWSTTTLPEAERLERIEELRAKRAELAAELERRGRNHGTGLTALST
jgi:hypothetical protein